MIINIDPEIVKILKNVPISECGLFDNYDDNIMHNQMQFLADMIIKSNPSRVLEIGTNHCYFPYFVSCIYPEVIVDTVDINSKAVIGVNILRRMNVKVNFFNNSSRDFFKTYNEKVDFAWIDGSHTKEDCLNDLMCCAKLKVPMICVDDFRSNDGVFRAVFDFYKFSDYKIYDQSYIRDLRGIICFSSY